MLKALFLLLLLPPWSFAQPFVDKPDLFLLKTYSKNNAIKGWVMSEKLDGVRGFWDGAKLISRGGKIFNPPKWWLINFPPFAIDGELWSRQNDFENISSIVRSKKDKGWSKIKLMVFEVPKQKGGLLKRLNVLAKRLKKYPTKFIKIIPQTQVKNQQQLNIFLEEIIKNNGEGVVLRNPKTPYQTGRLSSALKLKKYFDAECKVREILIGKGKYKNKMGSIKCQTTDGKLIKIGSGFSDFERDNPPKIGTIITFKYYGFTKNQRHKFPVFLRIRPITPIIQN